MSVAEDLAVLLPCAFSSSSSSLSQCLLLYTLQYCYHVLPIIVSVAVDLAVLLVMLQCLQSHFAIFDIPILGVHQLLKFTNDVTGKTW